MLPLWTYLHFSLKNIKKNEERWVSTSKNSSHQSWRGNTSVQLSTPFIYLSLVLYWGPLSPRPHVLPRATCIPAAQSRLVGLLTRGGLGLCGWVQGGPPRWAIHWVSLRCEELQPLPRGSADEVSEAEGARPHTAPSAASGPPSAAFRQPPRGRIKGGAASEEQSVALPRPAGPMQPAMMMFSSKYWARRGFSLDSALPEERPGGLTVSGGAGTEAAGGSGGRAASCRPAGLTLRPQASLAAAENPTGAASQRCREGVLKQQRKFR